jgi:hypothetical protein
VKTPGLGVTLLKAAPGASEVKVEMGLDLGILRKGLHAAGIENAFCGIEFVIPQLGALETGGDIAGVAHEQGGRIHDHLAVFLGFDGQNSQDGGRKTVRHAFLGFGTAIHGAEAHIDLVDHHLATGTLEMDHRAEDDAAVKGRFHRAGIGRRRHVIKNVLVEDGDFHQHPAAGAIKIERHIAVRPGETRWKGRQRRHHIRAQKQDRQPGRQDPERIEKRNRPDHRIPH